MGPLLAPALCQEPREQQKVLGLGSSAQLPGFGCVKVRVLLCALA